MSPTSANDGEWVSAASSPPWEVQSQEVAGIYQTNLLLPIAPWLSLRATPVTKPTLEKGGCDRWPMTLKKNSWLGVED